MALPVIFVLDDDVGVLHALRDDLSRRFGEDFNVTGTSSAAAGLATLRELACRYRAVALLIVDHDLSEMPGVGFLARSIARRSRSRPPCRASSRRAMPGTDRSSGWRGLSVTARQRCASRTSI